MPLREIVSDFVEYFVVGDYSFKLKFGKILFEEHSKVKGEFDISLLEDEMSLLRNKSSSVSMKESHLARLNEIVDGWISYDLLEVSNDDKKMREAFLQIGEAKNAQMVLEREEAKKLGKLLGSPKTNVSDGNDDESDVGESSSVGKEG
ncbi:unnamed protein product [Arabidopsis lyrata]|nr:unnamed protein product [Arabidopsis lyrata]